MELTTIRNILCIYWAFFGSVFIIHAQNKGDIPNEVDKIWALVEPALDKPEADTLGFFMLQQLRAQCEEDNNCLYSACETLLKILENRDKYLISIPIAEELVKVAREQQDLEALAYSLERLVALCILIDDVERVVLLRQELIQLYEQMGNQAKVIKAKVLLLEERVWVLNEVEETLPEIEALFDQAVDLKLTETVKDLLIRLKYIYEEFKYVEKLRKIIGKLEKIPLSDPLKTSEVLFAFHAASGRADLLMLDKKYEQAKKLYLKALGIARLRYRSYHDTWSEVYIIHRLAKLEWAMGNAAEAMSYLDIGYDISKELNLYDHFSVNLEIRLEIAEAENRFEDVVQLNKEIYEHQAKRDRVSADFDIKKHYLQLSTDQLMAEKEKQALNIRLKNSQLRNSIMIAVFVSLLAVGLFIGLWKQRQRKEELAVQNQLIQKQSEQLKSLDAAKSLFFANVSHELRTPLTLMLGPVHTLLKDKQLTGKQSQLLQMTERNGKQLQQLINEILNLRKLEMGKMELHTQATSLASFFRQHFAPFESLAESKQIDFSYSVFIEKDQVASLDPEKCRQVLSNLLSNAFKFTPQGGQIRAEVGLDHGELQLTVSDTGPGIHPDDLPHLFDRYFQTHRPNKPAEGGTGIGLALCKEYAELFGGKIEVESSLGKGSVFKLFFPITLVDPEDVDLKTDLQRNDGGPQITSDSLAQSALTFSNQQLVSSNQPPRPTILVVEDNPDLQDYIRLILSDQYEVVTAGNGQEALEMLHQPSTNNHQPSTINYQLVLSDLMMPVMDGFQLLERLKSNDATRHIPFIMLTARADMQDKLKALRIGVDDYLIKPFNEEELLARIENLLKNQVARFQELEQESPSETAGSVLSPEDLEWLESFESYVTENLSMGILDVSLLAQEFAMSQSTLLRQLKRLTGLTTNQYLNEVRLNEARRLLESDDRQSVSVVADKVGYGDPRSFSRSFKKRFGKLPSEVERV